ncbi:MAG: hypothetical protein PHX08_06380 [Lachnospiraceae bacterium]|nr:hypothetical protein [Lachnospiraceae bacterium]
MENSIEYAPNGSAVVSTIKKESEKQQTIQSIFKERYYKKKASKYLIRLYEDKDRVEAAMQEKEFKKTEEWKNRKCREQSIKVRAIEFVFIGVFFIIISLSIDYRVTTVNPNYQLWKSILSIANTISSIFIGMGVGTIFLDFFAYIQYARERLMSDGKLQSGLTAN